MKALKTAVCVLFKSNKDNKEKEQKKRSYKAEEKDINKDKDKQLVNSIAIYYTCIKVLLSKLVDKLIR